MSCQILGNKLWQWKQSSNLCTGREQSLVLLWMVTYSYSTLESFRMSFLTISLFRILFSFVLVLIHCALKEKYKENSLLPSVLGNNRPFQAKKPLSLQTAEVELTFLNELFGDIIWQCQRDSYFVRYFCYLYLEKGELKSQPRNLPLLFVACYFVLLWGVQNLLWHLSLLEYLKFKMIFWKKNLIFRGLCFTLHRCLESDGPDSQLYKNTL